MKDYEYILKDCLYNQDFICPVCNKVLQRGNVGINKIDLHHKMRNTKGNRKLYPLLIDHVWNLEAVHHEPCHINHHGSCGKLSDIEAKELENKLRDNIDESSYI